MDFIKQYNIKIYSQAGAYKTTINPKKIKSDISFSEELNWWQGNITISLDFPYNYNLIGKWDIIKVNVIDELYPKWKPRYWGYVEYINRINDEDSERIELSILWLFTLLNEVMYKSISQWGAYDFSITDDPRDIVWEIIDNFNTVYPFWWSWLLIKDIEWYGSNVTIPFTYVDSLSAIKTVQELIGRQFFIDENRTVKFKPKTDGATHTFKLDNELVSINSSETILNLVNRFFVTRNWWITKTYEDLTSQSLYWIREKWERKDDIVEESVQDAYWNQYIADNKDPKAESKLLINYKYKSISYNIWDDTKIWDDSDIWQDVWKIINTEDIRPWDFVKTLNTKYNINGVKIQKLDYNPEYITLYLDKYVWLSNLLLIK